MQVRPEDTSAYMLDRLEEMMMIVPVDAENDETQNVTEEDRRDWSQRREVRPDWYAQLEHHDRDDYRDHAITEGFQAIAGHLRLGILTRPFIVILKRSRLYLYPR